MNSIKITIQNQTISLFFPSRSFTVSYGTTKDCRLPTPDFRKVNFRLNFDFSGKFLKFFLASIFFCAAACVFSRSYKFQLFLCSLVNTCTIKQIKSYHFEIIVQPDRRTPTEPHECGRGTHISQIQATSIGRQHLVSRRIFNCKIRCSTT